MASSAPDNPTRDRLAEFFHRNGYIRRQDAARLKKGSELYKKGAEVRLVAMSAEELAEIRGLLKRAGFKPARSFRKSRRWCQPIYGVAAMARFLAMTGER